MHPDLIREEYEGLKCEGNHCLEGYAFDLIDEIANILHFKYEFRLVPGNKYGAYNKETKKWDGLVKELLDHVGSFSRLKYCISTNYAIQFVINRMLIWQYVI